MASARPFSELPWAGRSYGTLAEKAGFYAEHSEAMAALGASLLLLVGYFCFVHFHKRPRPTTYRARVDKLPDWISPAALRYVLQKGFDTKCILVCLLNANMKGCYSIRWAKQGFMALRNEDADFSRLNEDERRGLALYPNHFRERVFVTQTNSRMTHSMAENMDTYYKTSFRRFFRKKTGWLIGGIAASILLSLMVMLVAGQEKHLLTWMLYEFALWICVIVPVFFFSLIFKDRYWFGIAYCISFILVGLVALYVIETHLTAPLLTPLVVLPILVPLLFMRRIQAYTESGQRMVNLANSYREGLIRRMEDLRESGGDMMELADEMPFILALDLEDRITPYFRKMLSRTRYEPFQIFDRMQH
jgi:hypothetical protein